MKKQLLLIALLMALVSSIAFATSVNVLGNVDEKPRTIALAYYGADGNREMIDGAYDITDNQGERWNLSKAGRAQTNNFVLVIDGNMRSQMQFEVTVKSSKFKLVRDGELVVVDNAPQPATKFVKTGRSIPFGKLSQGQNNDEFGTFYLYWDGKPNGNLPAGDYQSDVTITYSIV